MMKFLIPLMCLAILMVACTPTEDETLPTRVVLPTDEIAIAQEVITEEPIDPLENATEMPIDPLENATEMPIDPLENATEMPIDPLENVTEMPIDPLENATEMPIDPLENATEMPIDPLTNSNPTPIVIPPLQQTQPPTPTQSGGLTVVMPTFDLSNLPTSVPTITPTPIPYPVTDDFSRLRQSDAIVRLRGTIEIAIDATTDDIYYTITDKNGVVVQLTFDFATINLLPAQGEAIDAIGTIQTSSYGHTALLIEAISIVPLSVLDERDR